MDHYPIPRKCVIPPVRVPYLRFRGKPCTFNKSPFTQYPALHGYDKQRFLQFGDYTNNGTKNPDETAAFLQEWLFFGLLSEFLEQPLVRGKFICQDEKGEIVVTTYLPDTLLDWWIETGQRLTPDQRKERIIRIRSLLSEAQSFVASSVSYDGIHNSQCPLTPEIKLSIINLGNTLTTAFMKIGGNPFQWGESEWTRTRLLEGGWCPSDIAMLNKRLPAGSTYFLTLLGPRKIHKDHSRCTTDFCPANNVDEKKYKVHHVQKDCDCQLVTLSSDDLERIILDNKRPLISIVYRGNDIDIELVENTSRIRYIAISHVWADGLGNPNINGLPKCQIQRLFRYMKDLGPSEDPEQDPVFWMDTLCIPPRTYKNAKKRAIADMRKVYEEAEKVLILDNELACSCSHGGNIEVMLRLLSSSWMRRLWTMQEGVLNKSPWVQFKDGAINLNHVQDWIMHDIVPNRSVLIEQTMKFEAAMGWYLMRQIREAGHPGNLNFAWNAAQFRSTTNTTDEPLCLAILLGLETTSLTNIEVGESEEENTLAADKRMKEFLRLRKFFPVEFLFVIGERFKESGYRWAPKSFIHRGVTENVLINNQSPSGEFIITASPNEITGFYCVAPQTFELTLCGEPLNNIFWFKCAKNNKWYRITDSQGRKPLKSWEELKFHTLNNPAVLLSAVVQRGIGAIGAVVEVDIERKDENGHMFGRYVSRVHFVEEIEDVEKRLSRDIPALQSSDTRAVKDGRLIARGSLETRSVSRGQSQGRHTFHIGAVTEVTANQGLWMEMLKVRRTLEFQIV